MTEAKEDKDHETNLNPPDGGVEPEMEQCQTCEPCCIILPCSYQGLPPAMAYLATLNEIYVHQIMELTEVLIGWEQNNRYDICDSRGQKIMFALENTDCCSRQILGNCRPFVLNITDINGQPLMMMYRPLRCQASCMWCCCLQKMEIESPPGILQGTVKQKWTCCLPKYKVYNLQNQCIFTIIGPCLVGLCCVDIVFHVYDGDSEINEVGQIRKHWGGYREICGQANDFTVKFFSDMDVMKKTLLFGSTFLIDLNYFERSGSFAAKLMLLGKCLKI